LSYQLLRDLFVQNFLHGERDDDGVVGFEETVNLAQRVFRKLPVFLRTRASWTQRGRM
jgi:hypothetical protein